MAPSSLHSLPPVSADDHAPTLAGNCYDSPDSSSTHGLAPPQASPSQSRSHLASGLALKTITSMIPHDWVKCNDDVRQISGLCSSWLRGKDPSMTLGAFQHLWCHNHALASVHTVETGPEGRLELRVHLSTSSPVPLF
ncbi:TPA: hypothetical protein ACH3X1_009685 [Trebouxia sp. C0004]